MTAHLVRHRQAYAYCAYCPKVCRFACPVSDATQTETTSTWGKMTEAFLVTRKARPLDDGGARALYACTGCMRCRSFCRHENEVGFALFSARQLALGSGAAPEAAERTRAAMARDGNPFGADLAGELQRHRAAASADSRALLFPGCTALAESPDTLADALAVASELGVGLALRDGAARCCGYPLYAAGDLKAFEHHARRTAQALAGERDLVVADPGCAYTFKVVYPRIGAALAGQVRTLVEVLAVAAEGVGPRPALDETVAYHDACHLGRGLGVYEPPRRLLRRAVRGVREALENRAEGGCSGGGGLLPRTMPEVAVEIARRQGERLAGDEAIVTACPTSRRMFERAGRRSEDLVSVLRRWLRGGTA